jgi:hypothetical protein
MRGFGLDLFKVREGSMAGSYGQGIKSLSFIKTIGIHSTYGTVCISVASKLIESWR